MTWLVALVVVEDDEWWRGFSEPVVDAMVLVAVAVKSRPLVINSVLVLSLCVGEVPGAWLVLDGFIVGQRRCRFRFGRMHR